MGIVSVIKKWQAAAKNAEKRANNRASSRKTNVLRNRFIRMEELEDRRLLAVDLANNWNVDASVGALDTEIVASQIPSSVAGDISLATTYDPPIIDTNSFYTNASNNISFSWPSVDFAVSYTVQYSADGVDFTPLGGDITSNEDATISFSYSGDLLSAGVEYSFKATAIFPGDEKVASDPESWTTLGANQLLAPIIDIPPPPTGGFFSRSFMEFYRRRRYIHGSTEYRRNELGKRGARTARFKFDDPKNRRAYSGYQLPFPRQSARLHQRRFAILRRRIRDDLERD